MIEMFVFEDSGGRAAVLAAAEGQFDDDDETGAVDGSTDGSGPGR